MRKQKPIHKMAGMLKPDPLPSEADPCAIGFWVTGSNTVILPLMTLTIGLPRATKVGVCVIGIAWVQIEIEDR
jgi:hypothetical protein